MLEEPYTARRGLLSFARNMLHSREWRIYYRDLIHYWFYMYAEDALNVFGIISLPFSLGFLAWIAYKIWSGT